MKKRNYYAKHKVKNENQIVCSFDTETDGLGGKVLCLSYSTPAQTDIFLGDNCVKEWLNNVFFNYCYPAIHYAHFAQYDWRYILPALIDLHQSCEIVLSIKLRSETDIFRVEAKKDGKLFVMSDSYALYPHTLKNFAKQFAPDYQKLELDFSKEVFDCKNPRHVEYAKRDAESLRQCMLNFSLATKKHFGVNVGQTAAGTSVKAWQHTLPDDLFIAFSDPGEREDFIRCAYYGGVVFLTDTAPYSDCKTFDINSSYPATMLEYPLPWGTPRECDILQYDYPAIYRCRVKAPDFLQIPIIPARNEHGSLRWYSGEFETYCTNIELQFAQLNGYELLEIYDGIIWNEVISPFVDFISKCRDIRTQHKNTSYEVLAKLKQNSLYGKFGAKRERNTIIFGQENIDPNKHENVTKLHDFCEDVYSAVEYSEDMPCKPEWAVFITAYSRIRLLQAAYSIGVENVLYGDTDSITVKKNADLSKLKIGSDYGSFKLEKEWKIFRAIAPKTYAGIVGCDYVGKAKGVPIKSMAQAQFAELFNHGLVEVNYNTLPSLLVALKKGIRYATPAHRKSSDFQNSLHYYCIGTKCYLKSEHGQDYQPANLESAKA